MLVREVVNKLMEEVAESKHKVLFTTAKKLAERFCQCDDFEQLLLLNGDFLQGLDDYFTDIDLFEEFGFGVNTYRAVSSEQIMIMAELQ